MSKVVVKMTSEDVNPALLQRVADELNIGVPIHAWAVEEGRLKLYLAYGQEAVWPEQRDTDGGPRTGERGGPRTGYGEEREGLRLGVDYEWREVEGKVPPIPEDLSGLKKQVLVRLAIKNGIRIKRRKNFLKAEYVEVLARRRKELEVCGDDVGAVGRAGAAADWR